MKVLMLILLSCTIALVSGSPAQACGDKFLVPGQSPEFSQAFAADQPGRILIYRNASSEVAQTVMDDGLRDTLERVGHIVEVVESSSDLREALSSSRYDIILADVEDAAVMDARGGSQSPMVLPVVYKASWTEVTRLKETHPMVLNAPSRASQMLTLIEEAIDVSRSAQTAAH